MTDAAPVDLGKLKAKIDIYAQHGSVAGLVILVDQIASHAEALAAEVARLREMLQQQGAIAMAMLEVFHLNSQHSRLNGHVPLSECRATICANNRAKIAALANDPQEAASHAADETSL